MFKSNFQTHRFYVEYGPNSLFERVKFKMQDVHELNLEGPHFKMRLRERSIPQEILESLRNFDEDTWALKTVEVRTDKGKFVSSTWEKSVAGHRYQITIGIGNIVETIVEKDSSGAGKCVQNGELYDMVEMVNKNLMAAEKR